MSLNSSSRAAAIHFHREDVRFELSKKKLLKKWLQRIIEREKCVLEELSFVFCSDDYLHKLNLAYLNHDTLTDVITFPYEEPPLISGDVFISVDRTKENAALYDGDAENELHRVMAHGLLHLCGYGDKSDDERSKMHSKEEEALQLLHQMID
ncbi:MAG: rRNA maturation RNase YbeY [Saprospiraceae bacterium]|nr:rRNA maturation RNase YbeY [Saprospiraceae bacterium]